MEIFDPCNDGVRIHEAKFLPLIVCALRPLGGSVSGRRGGDGRARYAGHQNRWRVSRNRRCLNFYARRREQSDIRKLTVPRFMTKG